MTSYLSNGYDVMSYFAKFEKFLPHTISIPSFMTVGSQMPELDQGVNFLPPPPAYKIGSKNTQYKLQLKISLHKQSAMRADQNLSKNHSNLTLPDRVIAIYCSKKC